MIWQDAQSEIQVMRWDDRLWDGWRWDVEMVDCEIVRDGWRWDKMVDDHLISHLSQIGLS